jgi:hypothetical protein
MGKEIGPYRSGIPDPGSDIVWNVLWQFNSWLCNYIMTFWVSKGKTKRNYFNVEWWIPEDLQIPQMEEHTLHSQAKTGAENTPCLCVDMFETCQTDLCISVQLPIAQWVSCRNADYKGSWL